MQIIYLINKKPNDIKQLINEIFNNYIKEKNEYDIKMYINELYGIIIEIKKSDIDKLTIFNNKLFLYEADDPLLFLDDEIYYYNDKYYLNPKKIDIKLLEYTKLIYDDFVYKVLGRGIKI